MGDAVFRHLVSDDAAQQEPGVQVQIVEPQAGHVEAEMNHPHGKPQRLYAPAAIQLEAAALTAREEMAILLLKGDQDTGERDVFQPGQVPSLLENQQAARGEAYPRMTSFLQNLSLIHI